MTVDTVAGVTVVPDGIVVDATNGRQDVGGASIAPADHADMAADTAVGVVAPAVPRRRSACFPSARPALGDRGCCGVFPFVMFCFAACCYLYDCGPGRN